MDLSWNTGRGKMFWLRIAVMLIGITLTQAQKCSSPAISENLFESGVLNQIDIPVGYLGQVATYPMENTVRITSYKNTNIDSNLTYIDAKLVGNNLVFSTNVNFGKYEEYETTVQIYVQVTFVCKQGNRDMLFKQSIKVENNHAPQFSKPSYEFIVQLPLFKGFDLAYFIEITASDLDLNDRITFSTDSTVIAVGTSDKMIDKKTYLATMNAIDRISTINGQMEFTITATDKGGRTATVQVQMIPDEGGESGYDLEFEMEIYRGTVDYTNGINLNMQEIALKRDSWTEEVEFSLGGDNSDLFSLSHFENTVYVTLGQSVSQEDLEGRMYLMCTVIASIGESSTSAVVLVDVPPIECDIPTTTECPMVTCPDCPELTTMEPFTCPPQIECPEVTTLEPFTCPEPVTCPDFTTMEPSTCPTIPECPEVTTVAYEECPPCTTQMIETTTFEPFTCPAIIECPELTTIAAEECPPCTTAMVEFTTSEPFTCPVVTECPEWTTVTMPDCPECVCPTTELWTTVTQEQTEYSTTELMTVTEAENTTPNPDPVQPPTFEESWYTFAIKEADTGVIGQVKATAKDTEAKVEYSIIVGENLLTKLTIDASSGQLVLHEKLIPRIYSFEVGANTGENTATATVVVFLIVRSDSECLDEEAVSKTLQIKHLIENVEHKDMFNLKTDMCEYKVDETVPSGQEFFTIDNTAKMLHSVKLNREDPIFADMLVAQFQIILRLDCMSRVRRSAFQNETVQPVPAVDSRDRDYVLAHDINFSTKMTYLTVIVDDENDNAPEFVVPKADNMLVGYPEARVAESVMPPYLIEIKAIDADAGINAKIQYSLDANEHFGIDAESGVVYPMKNAMTSTELVTLRIHATDMNGSSDGNDTPRTLKVRRLQSEHLTVITAHNVGIESAAKIIEYIQTSVGLKLHLLHVAAVPLTDNGGQKRLSFIQRLRSMLLGGRALANGKDDGGVVAKAVRMIVYGFDSNDNPISTKEIQKELGDVGDSYDISALPLVDVQGGGAGNGNGGNSSDNTSGGDSANVALIVVVSVLAILLVIVCVVAFIGWWYWVRPYEYKAMDESASSSPTNTLAVDYEAGGVRAVSSPQAEQKYTKSADGGGVQQITGMTTQESSDDANRLARTLGARLDDDKNSSDENLDDADTKERRKSFVTFNELVERIEIDPDDEQSYKF